MSDTETIGAPPKSKPAPSPADRKVFAQVDKWMEVIRQINEPELDEQAKP
jgi:hypothetical protein